MNIEEMKDVRSDVDAIIEKLTSSAQTENKIIAEIDRCKQYADRMEEILTECGRLRDAFGVQMKQTRMGVKEDLEDAIASVTSREIIHKIIERLGWAVDLHSR